MERVSTLTTETRNDLHLTSTGVGHAIRKTTQFPLEDFKVPNPEWNITPTQQHTESDASRTNPLPPSLSLASTSADPRLTDIYQTTAATAHGYQPSGTILEHSTHKKAPGSWKVNYTLDTIHKLNVKPWRRPLVMANQCSEMKAQYQAKPEAISSIISHSGNPQPPTLADHFLEGPTKGLAPSTVNKKLQGRSFVPQNQAILDRLEPYMTTNNWYHRTFSAEEMNKYPKKDVPTYWQCEDYPKAWGHGMKENPLPRKLARTDPGPMRDRTIFRSRTTIPRLPSTSQPIPSGLLSMHAETYTRPSDEKQKELFYCPVQSTLPVEAPDKTLLQTVPHMYKTANMTYGTGPAQLACID